MSSIKNRYYHGIALAIILGFIPVSALAISVTVSPVATNVAVLANATVSWTATASGCTSAASFSFKKKPKHGTTAGAADFASTGRFSYTNDANLGAAKEKLTVEATCDGFKNSVTLKVYNPANSCGGNNSGMVIFDNTATTHLASIKSNLKFFAGCGKSSTTIDDGSGGNSINIEDFQVITRDISANPDKLMLSVGAEELEVTDQLVNTDDQSNFFADGKHLFELNRLRSTADWLSGSTAGSANITPKDTVASGAYGTMSLKQFIQHIADGHTLYGIVRVKVGLQQGQRSKCSDSVQNANCTKNALGLTVAKNEIYGFCDSTATTGLCAATECAPSKANDASKYFDNIKASQSICGISLPSTAKIKVKGSLLFDFVDHISGDAIPLAQLPYAPKELYFKVTVPIMVNWANDNDSDGAMDGMDTIAAISNAFTSGGELTPAITYSSIPTESLQAYQYQVGSALLNDDTFTNLSNPDKYHLLMPSGYANGWADAFDQLNLTTAIWATLPPSGCLNSGNSACDKFGVPSDAGATMTANDVRSNGFEDIPTYLYSGGLIDMHGHVNISGLVYVPQAMELEAKSSTTRQYVSGSIVIRDGFYIEAKDSTVTVISADPQSYASAKRHVSSSTPPTFSGKKGGPGSTDDGSDSGGGDGGNNDVSSPCIGCADGGGGGGAPAGPSLWMEIRPQ